MRSIAKFVNRFFPFLVPLALLVGMFLGDIIILEHSLGSIAFAGVTFMGGMKMDFSSFSRTITSPKPMLLSLSILRLLIPLWAIVVSTLLFSNDVYTRTGLLLFSVLPVGVNSVLWTMMAKGNIPLSLTVVLIDTFLAPFILPLSILFLTGTQIELDTVGMMISLLLMIVIPTFTGMIINQVSKGELTKKWDKKMGVISKALIVFLMLVNGTNVREHLPAIDLRLLMIIGTMIFLSLSGYILSWFLAKVLKLSVNDLKATVFLGGIRNINVGILIALGYFPVAVSIPIISGVLFQQIVCAAFANKLLKHFGDSE